MCVLLLQPRNVLPPDAHIAAKTGQLEDLLIQFEEHQNNQSELLSERDENGFQLLHQGVAGGNEDIVRLLVEKGAEINSRTHGGYGDTPLRIAEKELGWSHPIAQYLKGMGALSIGPEL